MKALYFIASLFVLAPAIAQQKKAEQTFITALNRFASGTKTQHWAHGESVLESPFQLIGDSLTATFGYRGDSTDYRLRFTAPLKQLGSVDHDEFLILVFPFDRVVIYRGEGKNGNLDYWTTDFMLHLGKVESEQNESDKEKVMKAWRELQDSWRGK